MHFDTLEGKLLVAMPSIGDPRFDKSVIYICAHSADGAMGLIVNKRAEELNFSELLDQLSLEGGDGTVPIYIGGPVEHARGMVLHSADYTKDDHTMKVSENVAMTSSMEILSDIAKGDGPDKGLLALGYSGWGPGQLEQEIRSNGWLVADADSAIIFNDEDAKKWENALDQIGIDPRLLSAEGGSA
ncbi:MAG: YqgE/AlgH family protein [Pseudomonadota bacterium]